MAGDNTIVRLLRDEIDAASAAHELGIDVGRVSDRRRSYLRRKLPKINGEVRAAVDGPVEIARDAWGVAHISANAVADGFFGLGYAMAQDRLWQLDHMRRLASGRLAEILGPDALPQDRLHRTIGLRRSAEAAVAAAGDEVLMVLDSLSRGINVAMTAAEGRLPVEFDVLDYAPEPWEPADTVAVWKWRWWMLTGRLNILAVAEAGKRHLTPEQFDAFMTSEANEETIVPSVEPAHTGGHDTGEGSNNWAVGGSRTVSGGAILATDPHNGVELSRQWYQAQLTVPGIDAIGAFFLGTPGIYLGHTRGAAWGVTNHTASARDLYVETISADNPRLYLETREWQSLTVREEVLEVKGRPEETFLIRETPRGPLVEAFVPKVEAKDLPPLSLRWMGAQATTGFEAMLALERSQSLEDVVAALEQWPFPLLNFVFSDGQGRVGYHAAGQVPGREKTFRGFRDGQREDHGWEGVIPFDEMPHLVDPDRDWVASANNPPRGGSGPYLTLGSWSDGYRFRRIRTRIEVEEKHTVETIGAIHTDVVLGRAEDLAHRVANLASKGRRKEIRAWAEVLEAWDGSYTVDEIAPTLFTAFWDAWLKRVARARFPGALVSMVKDRCGSVGRRLLLGETVDWFDDGVDVEAEAIGAVGDAVQNLKRSVGARKSQWRWGRLHTVTFGHPVATTPALKKLLTVGPVETSGATGTVRAAGHSIAEPFIVTGLSTYRMVVDLSDPAHGKATAAGGQSGHPASPHYRTQTDLWLADDYHPLLMDREDIEKNLEGRLTLRPGSSDQ